MRLLNQSYPWLAVDHPTPSLSPSLLVCQAPWTNFEALTSLQVLMLWAFEGVWGHWRMGPWNQVGTPEWRHQLWAGSSWCLCPVSHSPPAAPRCLEKKQRCVIHQRNGDKYSPCWINIPRITHVSFKVKQRSCATWQPPIWPEKSRHMDGSR